MLRTFLLLFLSAFVFQTHAKVLCPPPDPNTQPLCIKAGSVFDAPAGWKGVSQLFMEDGSTLRLDPKKLAHWEIAIGSATFGEDTTIDLSGQDVTFIPEPAGNGQAQTDQCRSGYNGQLGKPGERGGDSASADIKIGKLVTGSTYVRRRGGQGGVGGAGGNGGQGGNGNLGCSCNGAPGGFGELGGRGGNGGDAKRVQIFFKQLTAGSTLSTMGETRSITAPGMNDGPESKPGKGGQPGKGGIGGHGGGHCGFSQDGPSYDHEAYRAGNQGPGLDGVDYRFFLVPWR